MLRNRDERLDWSAAAGVAALVAYATWTRASYLLADRYPLGIDGYYYAVQVRELLEHGRLVYPGAPLALWWLARFGAIFGVVAGVKIGAASGTALAAAPAYVLARRAAGGSRAIGLFGAALVATSAESFFLTTEFVKEGLGLTVALAQVVLAAAAIERPSRARVVGAIALLVAAAMTHESAAALALLCNAPLFLARPRLRRWMPWVAALALLVLLASEWRMLLEMLGARASFSLPVLDRARADLYFDHEVAIAAGLAAAAVVLTALPRRLAPPAPRDGPHDVGGLVVVGFAVMALVAALPWLDARDVQGGGFRLRVAVFVTLAPLAGFVVARASALARVAPRARALLALGATCALIALRPLASDEGVVRTHPMAVVAVRAVEGALPDGATAVTNDRKIAFMVRWYARRPMRLHPPGDYRLIPLPLMRPDLLRVVGALRRDRPPGVALPRSLHPLHENGLLLIPEATFQHLLRRVDAPTRAHYRAWPTT